MIIKRNRGRDWLDWRRRMIAAAQWAGLGGCVLLLGALVFGEMGLPRYVAMRDHAARLEQEIQDLQRSNRALRAEIDRVDRDPAKIEQLARERLGYVRKGEMVYQLSPEPSGKQEPAR